MTRSCDAGRVPTTPALERLRVLSIKAHEEQSEALYPTNPLDDLPVDMDGPMLAVQADHAKRRLLNSIWAQEARITVKDHASEQHKRAQRNLFGKLLHVGSVSDEPMQLPDKRIVDRVLNLPEEWSAILSPADRTALWDRTRGLSWDDAFALMRDVVNDRSDLPHAQADAVFALVEANRQRFERPRYAEDATVQLRLSWSAVRGGPDNWKPFLARVEDAMWEAVVTGEVVSVPFRLTGAVANEDPIDMRVDVHPELMRHHLQTSAACPEVRGVSIDVGPETTVVRVLLKAEPMIRTVDGCLHVLARDFGYRNTIALTMVAIPLEGISQERLDWVERINGIREVEAAKAETRRFLEAHVSDAVPVLQHVFDGHHFMKAVAKHGKRLDALRREVALVYRRIRSLKHEVNRFLGAPADALVDLDLLHGDPKVDNHVRRLGKLLPLVARLKACKRGVHATVRGLKASWFGFLANVEAELAAEWKALLVHEDLTIGAIPTDDEDYKGPAFNRMFANGSRSGFERPAREKHAWRGTPMVELPSYHTSTTDHRHGVVDGEQRKDRTFTSAVDGTTHDADGWASHTLSCILVMRRKAGRAPGAEVTKAA